MILKKRRFPIKLIPQVRNLKTRDKILKTKFFIYFFFIKSFNMFTKRVSRMA